MHLLITNIWKKCLREKRETVGFLKKQAFLPGNLMIRRLKLTDRYILSMISYTNHTKGGNIMKAPKGKYAWTATVGEKGQIVIPKQARNLFEIKETLAKGKK